MRFNNGNKKQLLISISALILVLVTGVSFTYSWIEGGNKGYVNGNEIQISSDSSLTMIQDGKNVTSIVLPTCNLQEVSSADGRNFFFPMSDNTTSDTSTMTFRDGVPTDVNTKYVSIDFELLAGDSATDVYLGAGTIVQCSNKDVADALRMAFFSNDGKDLWVFKPTQMPNIPNITYTPITAITSVGTPTTTTTSTKGYGDFYFKGENSVPIFDLKKGETKKMTLAIWLEGTEFQGNTIADTDLSIYIDFTTTVDDLVKYKFVDNTHGYGDALAEYWVARTNSLVSGGTQYETMMYIYDNVSKRYYAMDKTVKESKTNGAEWVGYVPKSITDFTFRRYSVDIDQWWNEWNPSMSDIKLDPQGGHTFIAICGNGVGAGTELTGCMGYWQDSEDTIRVFFQLQTGWNNTKCYAWRNDGTYATKTWPGSEMTFSHNNGDNKPVYYIDLTGASKLAGIQFNNSNNTEQYQIEDKQYFFNGFITWYESPTSNGKWLYKDELNSLIYPQS